MQTITFHYVRPWDITDNPKTKIVTLLSSPVKLKK